MRAMRMWCGSSSTDLRDGALTNPNLRPVMLSGGLITTSALSKPHKRQPDQRGSRRAWLSLHPGPLASWIRLGCAQRVDPPTASPIPHAAPHRNSRDTADHVAGWLNARVAI